MWRIEVFSQHTKSNQMDPRRGVTALSPSRGIPAMPCSSHTQRSWSLCGIPLKFQQTPSRLVSSSSSSQEESSHRNAEEISTRGVGTALTGGSGMAGHPNSRLGTLFHLSMHKALISFAPQPRERNPIRRFRRPVISSSSSPRTTGQICGDDKEIWG